MIVQMWNKVIVKDGTRQNMLTTKKHVRILSPMAGKSSSISQSKDKIVYHKQQAENNVCKQNDNLIKSNNNNKWEEWVKTVIRDSYLTNKGGSNGIVKKPDKSNTPTKGKSKETISLELVLMIYTLEDSWHAQ